MLQNALLLLRSAQPAYGRLIPGVGIACLVAAAAYGVRGLPFLTAVSPIFLAMLLGLLVGGFVQLPSALTPGLALASTRFLRIALVLLGLQISFADILTIDAVAVVSVAVLVGATIVLTSLAGKAIGVSTSLAQLIGVGTAVCGASAIMAAQSVTDAPEEEVGYALACITLLGTLSMILYPPIGTALHLSQQSFGVWAGASIHEVAQAAGAAVGFGETAGRYGVIVKLGRVLLLVPIVLGLAFAVRRGRPGGQVKVSPPYFVAGFIAMVALNSLIEIPPGIRLAASTLTTVLLTISLAALGLSIVFRRLFAIGVRPVLLAVCATLFLGASTLLLISVHPIQ